MRAKHAERQQAVELRKRGLSYSEIQAHVAVSQASLSLWLRGIELMDAQAQRLADKKRAGNRAAAKRVRVLRLERISRVTEQGEREAHTYLQDREHLWVLGVALY